MVRISDLVKGKTPTPVPQGEKVRLSNLSELINRNESPEEAARQPLKTVPEPSQEAATQKPSEPDTEKPAAVAPDQSREAVPEPPRVTPTQSPSKPDAGKPAAPGPEQSREAISAEPPQTGRKPAPEKEPPTPALPQVELPPDACLAPDGRALYFDAQAHLHEVRENLLAGKTISLKRPLEIIGSMIAEPAVADQMYRLTLALGCGDDMYVTSPVNSMIYSFKIGTRMGYSRAKLTEISLSALHHDIGMHLIPDAILKKEGKLSETEFALIKKHTETGRELFASLNYPNVSRAIYEHHERESGQGYPSRLKGDEICEYAKIIGICDSYEAMTHDRPHKKAAAQYISVLQLAESKDMFFPPYIMKIFLEVITLYPIGSYVRLNNKAIGVVVGTNPKNPLKPLVQIIIDGHGNKVTDERLINLAENNILTIVAGVSVAELPIC